MPDFISHLNEKKKQCLYATVVMHLLLANKFLFVPDKCCMSTFICKVSTVVVTQPNTAAFIIHSVGGLVCAYRVKKEKTKGVTDTTGTDGASAHSQLALFSRKPVTINPRLC